MRIAIYSGEIPSTTFIERLIEGMADRGHQVYLYGAGKASRSYPDSVIATPYRGKVSQLWLYLKYALLLRLFRPSEKRRLDALVMPARANRKIRFKLGMKYYPVLWHRPDIFHVQWAKDIDAWRWVQDFGMKLVLSLRGAHINYSPIANRRLAESYRRNFPRLDAFHGVSLAIGQEAQKYAAAPARIRTIYSGLDLDRLPFEPRLDYWSSTERPLQLLSVGRAHWKKGYHYALDCCKMLKDRGFDFRYTIIGAAGDEELLYKRRAWGLEEAVTLEGRVGFTEVAHCMRTADLLLLPSVEEGVANVVLEAMAVGTPVLSTDCGGMAEVIEEGRTGWLVPIRQPEAMAAKIQAVAVQSPEAVRNITHRARRYVEERHTRERMVFEMESMYQTLLSPQ